MLKIHFFVKKKHKRKLDLKISYTQANYANFQKFQSELSFLFQFYLFLFLFEVYVNNYEVNKPKPQNRVKKGRKLMKNKGCNLVF